MLAIFEAITYKIKLLTGYRFDHWARLVMYDECAVLLEQIDSPSLDVLEISGDIRRFIRGVRFKSYSQLDYPAFDVCKDRPDRTYDLVIVDQVFEHLTHPHAAGKNVHSMLKPGGHFLIMTPFMIRIHECPIDCSRWTPLGMRYFLSECGFPFEEVRSFAWGNRACVRANMDSWKVFGWGFFKPLINEPDFPVCVWALAKK